MRVCVSGGGGGWRRVGAWPSEPPYPSAPTTRTTTAHVGSVQSLSLSTLSGEERGTRVSDVAESLKPRRLSDTWQPVRPKIFALAVQDIAEEATCSCLALVGCSGQKAVPEIGERWVLLSAGEEEIDR